MPEKPENDKSKESNVSRREGFKDKGFESLEMPECDAYYLIEYLLEIGPTLPVGMGDGPLTHTELCAWQQNTGVALQSWEARMLRKLSAEYANQSFLSRKFDCEAPWADAPYLIPMPNLVAMRMKQHIAKLADF